MNLHPDRKTKRTSSETVDEIPTTKTKAMAEGKGDGMVEVDGSVMEGGGQILRMTSVFSVLLGKPVRITNIRAGRKTGGLRPQHLKGLELMAQLSQGELLNGSIGSTTIELRPGRLRGGECVIDTETAGSISLMIQTALPCALFAPHDTHIVLKGGTNVDFAPQIDYCTCVLQPVLKLCFGIDFDIQIKRRGYYPKGGGEVVLRCSPMTKHLDGVELTKRGNIVGFSGRSWVAGVLPPKLGAAAANTAKRTVHKSFPNLPTDISVVKETANDAPIGNGNGILLTATTDTGCVIAGDGLGKKGVSGDMLGEEAGKMLVRNLQEEGCVDEHMQDQLIVFMALAKGTSRIRTGPVTLHTKTAIYVAELLTTAKFSVNDLGEGLNEIVCEGMGLTPHC